jgi:hypothetical protein
MTAATVEQVPLYAYSRYVEQLIECPKLTKTASRVGLKIAKGFRADWGYCCYSIAQIAEYLNVSVRAVNTAIAELKDHKFIFVQKSPRRRNRYVPLFGQPAELLEKRTDRNEPAESTLAAKVDDPTCKNLHTTDVQKLAQHSIEETTDSLRESSAPYEERNIEKPTARCARGPRSRASAFFDSLAPKVREIRGWTPFAEAVLETQAVLSGWDPIALSRSVKRFLKKMKTTSPRWPGLVQADRRLTGWLKGEWYKTAGSYTYRGEEEFEDEYI